MSPTEASYRHKLVIDGSGVSLTRERAVRKAIGEGVERYASGFVRRGDSQSLVAAFEVQNAISPEQLCSFRHDQYVSGEVPFGRPELHVPLRWTHCVDLSANADASAPAQLVYMPYIAAKDETILDNLISTGIACGPTFEWATSKAVLEVIERDAFIVSWRTKNTVYHVPVELLGSPQISKWLEKFRLRGIEVQIGFIPAIGNLPVCVCCLRPKRKAIPHFVCGVSGAATVKAAIQGAIEEAAQSFIGLRRMIGERDDGFDPSEFTTFTSTHRHGKAFALREDLASAAWEHFRPGVDAVVAQDATGLSEIVSRVGDSGHRCFSADLTTVDVSLCGLAVVRALVTDVTALDVNFNHPHYGGRLKHQIINNYLPHPFP